jgi:hypothetical protein
MKITIRENGSLLIDGENTTTIKVKCDTGINFKTQGNSCHCYTDFIMIDSDVKNVEHEIRNFTFISTK